MRAVVQRVECAQVSVDGFFCGKISQGLLILLGVTHSDIDEDAAFLAGKISRLRIFDDGAGKMNLSVHDVRGSCLVVSQFTLYGDCRKGNRPSYIESARPEVAVPLYEKFCTDLQATGLPVETGRFQAEMKVELVNDGPVTIILESR